MRFFYMLFLLFLISHLYIFVALRRMLGGGWWQLPVGAWLAFMAGSWLFRMTPSLRPLMAGVQDLAFVWMGFSIMLCYCLLAADAVMLLARVFSCVGSCVGRADFWQRITLFLSGKRCLPLAFAAGLLLFGYALYEAQNIRVTRVDIVTSKLPAGSAPLCIVGMSDVHIGGLIGPWMLERMRKVVAEQNPDILALAGDTVDGDLSRRREDAEVLKRFPARLGRFAVTGNHEKYQGLAMSRAFLKRAGFRVLRGESVEVGGICVAGVDDDAFRGQFTPDTTDALRVLQAGRQGGGQGDDRFVLLLKHKPWVTKETAGYFDLQFSGHTHGGQFWPGSYVVRSIYKAPQGLSPVEGGVALSAEEEAEKGESLSRLFISNGVGFWGPPVRLGMPPEIVVITLVPQ